MKILLDLQGLQSASRERGIGRFVRSLAHAMIADGRGHDIHLLFSEDLGDRLAADEAEFLRVVPRENIHAFGPYGPVAGHAAAHGWRAATAARLREAKIRQIAPDILHVGSLFEGFVDDAVTSIGLLEAGHATAVTLYDLVPLADPDRYLRDEQARTFYFRHVQELKRADLLLSISEHSRDEAVTRLHIPAEKLPVVSCGVSEGFRRIDLAAPERAALAKRFGLPPAFLLYVGAADPRKNVNCLLRGFAALPEALRTGRGIVLAGRISGDEEAAARQEGTALGLDPDAIVTTGYVSEDELVRLYSLCNALVFPSSSEGFGLPPLEAMACGAPVLASDRTSLPAVVGRRDCLFDPSDPAALTALLERLLTDPAWRRELSAWGVERARGYSWSKVAVRAWDALEHLHASRPAPKAPAAHPRGRPRMAFVSPLPPDETGIADYSAELVRELLPVYEIDLIRPTTGTTDPWLSSACAERTVEFFEDHAAGYDRVLYSFGNSPFHVHMFGLLARHPGTVILHDAFLSDLAVHLTHGAEKLPAGVLGEIYRSHGLAGLKLLADERVPGIVRDLSMAGGVFRNAQGVLVHSRFAAEIARAAFGPPVEPLVAVIPQLRSLPRLRGKTAARAELGMSPDDFVICSFGIVTPRKLNDLIAEAFAGSGLATDESCRLIFVGPYTEPYGQRVLDAARSLEPTANVRLLGRMPDADYVRFMEAADVAVQLRTESRGETSRAVLDAMAFGLPVIATDVGPVSELPDEAVIKVPPETGPEALGRLLRRLRDAPGECTDRGGRARTVIRTAHDPRRIGGIVRGHVERFSLESMRSREAELITSCADAAVGRRLSAHDLHRLAYQTRALFPPPRLRQLLVDVTTIAGEDLRTGIQRVVRAVVERLVTHPPAGFRIEPVVIQDGVPVYARRFTEAVLRLPMGGLPAAVVDHGPGDHYLGLDWVPDRLPVLEPWFGRFRRAGGTTTIVVYDLLPIEQPHAFPDWMEGMHRRWFETIVEVADNLACISAATADSVVRCAAANPPRRPQPTRVGWFHLGHDVEASLPTAGIPVDGDAILAGMRARPTFLMVGTVEPRKGHGQVIEAFERLWKAGLDVALVIVGKEGWMVDAAADRARNSPEHGTRLVWLPRASDEFLGRLYGSAAALLAASEGEGFGLPLIEAAGHGTPVLARDLPVFREVGGAGASYFSARDPAELANAIRAWLADREAGLLPSPDGIARLTWAEATDQLVAILRGERTYRRIGAASDAEPRPRAEALL